MSLGLYYYLKRIYYYNEALSFDHFLHQTIPRFIVNDFYDIVTCHKIGHIQAVRFARHVCRLDDHTQRIIQTNLRVFTTQSVD